MSESHLPGFTADASLNRTIGHYRTAVSGLNKFLSLELVTPAALDYRSGQFEGPTPESLGSFGLPLSRSSLPPLFLPRSDPMGWPDPRFDPSDWLESGLDPKVAQKIPDTILFPDFIPAGTTCSTRRQLTCALEAWHQFSGPTLQHELDSCQKLYGCPDNYYCSRDINHAEAEYCCRKGTFACNGNCGGD